MSNILHHMSGIRLHNILEPYMEHCSSAGRNEKYDWEDLEVYCVIMELLINRGSSKNQAAVVLSKVMGTYSTAPTGSVRKLKDAFKEYKEGRGDDYGQYRHQEDFLGYEYEVGFLLSFDLSSPLKSEEKSFTKAVKALDKLCADIVSLILLKATVCILIYLVVAWHGLVKITMIPKSIFMRIVVIKKFI
ncbi:MAG: hypothetical protein OXQ96_04570 [Alphaproteobacteria bacterium]|nr:hypothetical protein [Alphaproteobacteria bacterium]